MKEPPQLPASSSPPPLVESSSAVKSDNPLWKRWWVWAIGLFVLTAMFRSDKNDKSPDASGDIAASTTASNGKPAAPSGPIVPESQKEFIKCIESFFGPYGDASNELKKSALRNKRRSALQSVVQDRSVTDWIGTIYEMGTTSDRKGYVTVRLHGTKHIAVQTWNNALSDVGSGTLIGSSSPVFSNLADLKEGSRVRFSGGFLADDDDFIDEVSITENGSMTDPSFVFRFSDIAKE